MSHGRENADETSWKKMRKNEEATAEIKAKRYCVKWSKRGLT